MGRFRSFLRRSAKPFAMAAVAGMLAISLTVTTTQKAEATPVAALPVIAAAESIVGGASLPLVMPSMAAMVVSITPVGWIVGGVILGAALAYGAYATKDYWLPYVTGDFGKPLNENTDVTADGSKQRIDPLLTATSAVLHGTTYDFTLGIANAGLSSTYSKGYAIVYRSWCKNGAGTIRLTPPAKFTSSYDNKLSTRTWTNFNSGCVAANGETVIGMKFGASSWAAGDPDLMEGTATTGPKNIIFVGTKGEQKKVFDARGSDVKYKTSVECVSDDGTKSTLTAEFLGSDGGAKFPSCAASGKGHGTGVNKIEGYAPTAPGVVGTTPETIWSTAAPAADPNYAKCDQSRPGSGCRMAITIDGKPCVVGQWECENWTELWKDSNTSTRVGCTYGPYTLSPDACSIMEPAYRPGGAPLTEANVDGNPSTRNNTDLSGQPFSPEPAVKPGAVPGAAGAPAAGDPAAQCWPQGWALFNPMWIFDSINCAFVPKQNLQARLQNTVNTVGTLPPMSWFSSVDMTAPGGASCPNWTIHVAGFSDNVICGSSFTDAVRGSRNLIFTMLSAAMVWPLIRSLWYASIPFIRVSPGSSK